MCYAYPAPRCSTPARNDLRKAHKALKSAERRLEEARVEFEAKRDAASEAKLRDSEAVFKKADAAAVKAKRSYDKAAEEKKAAYKKFKEQQAEYALTPAYIKGLRAKGDHEGADRQAAERKRRIAIAKSLEAVKQAELPDEASAPTVQPEQPATNGSGEQSAVESSNPVEAPVFGTLTKTDVEKFEQNGFRMWEGGQNRRAYLKNEQAFKIAGGRLAYYNTGNVSSATLPDLKLSNTRATALKQPYFDANKGEWSLTGNSEVDAILLPALEKFRKAM